MLTTMQAWYNYYCTFSPLKNFLVIPSGVLSSNSSVVRFERPPYSRIARMNCYGREWRVGQGVTGECVGQGVTRECVGQGVTGKFV